MNWMFRCRVFPDGSPDPTGADIAYGDGDEFPDPDEDENFGQWSWQHSTSTPYKFYHPDESFSSPHVPLMNKNVFIRSLRKEVTLKEEMNVTQNSSKISGFSANDMSNIMEDVNDSGSAPPPVRNRNYIMGVDANHNVVHHKPSGIFSESLNQSSATVVDRHPSCRKPLWEYGQSSSTATNVIQRHPFCRKPLWEY